MSGVMEHVSVVSGAKTLDDTQTRARRGDPLRPVATRRTGGMAGENGIDE
jgi:hypothetical protein